VLDPGGRVYQAGVGKILRNLSYPNPCPLMMMPRFVPPVQSQILFFNHHFTDDVIHCWAFFVGACAGHFEKQTRKRNREVSRS
jgi:hypothetical protein